MIFRRNKWGDFTSFTYLRHCLTGKPPLIPLLFCSLLLFYVGLFSRTPDPTQGQFNVLAELKVLEDAIDVHNALEIKLKQALLSKGLLSRPKVLNNVQIPILLIACNRIGVKRTLDNLLRYRRASTDSADSQFPITVSHGCDHKPTSDILTSYGKQIDVMHFKDTLHDTKVNYTKFQLPYRSVAHHYKFALDQMFLLKNHPVLIIVEDDLDIAPDFFDYFLATLPWLQSDRSLFCVSAWNDNGRPELINPKRTDLIYRTDFFSGLGWMLLRDFWLEIRDDWPDLYWDEYLRKPAVRKDRACLRPEIGRTITFGRQGISRGQFFDRYLKTMVLNSVKFPFLTEDLSYLQVDRYIPAWKQKVYNDSVAISIHDLKFDNLPQPELVPSLRVTYHSTDEFLHIATFLNLMKDLKSGVMRTAYMGVVPVTWKRHTLYIAPPENWKSYQPD